MRLDRTVLVGVRQQAHHAGALHCLSELRLLATGQARDPAGTKLAPLGQKTPERREILPVELLGRKKGTTLARRGRPTLLLLDPPASARLRHVTFQFGLLL